MPNPIQPVPSYAEVSESYTDPKTGKTKSAFNPVWLSWFLSLRESVGNPAIVVRTADLTLDSVMIGGGNNLIQTLGSLGIALQVLTSQGPGLPPIWADSPAGFTNPMTTKGDIIFENAALAADRLPIGSNTFVLTVVSGLPAWAAASGGGITALTGDVIASGTGSVAATFGSIADQRILARIAGSSGAPSAQSLTAILDDILGSTQGQLITRNGANWTVLSPGTTGLPLISAGAAANLLYAQLDTAGIAAAAVTYAKIQNVSASSKLIGSSASGSGAPPSEITLGTGLSMSGSTLNASGSPITINTQTASYTVTAADCDPKVPTVIEMNVATANTLTFPLNATTAIAIGSIVGWMQYGAGQVTLTPGTGAVNLRTSGSLTSRAQYSSGTATKIGTDEWLIEGDTS